MRDLSRIGSLQKGKCPTKSSSTGVCFVLILFASEILIPLKTRNKKHVFSFDLLYDVFIWRNQWLLKLEEVYVGQ